MRHLGYAASPLIRTTLETEVDSINGTRSEHVIPVGGRFFLYFAALTKGQVRGLPMPRELAAYHHTPTRHRQHEMASDSDLRRQD